MSYLYAFTPAQRFCVVDYETFSEANIKKRGAYGYSKHKSTAIMGVAYVTGTLAELQRIYEEITAASDESEEGEESERARLKRKYIKTWCPDERAKHRKDHSTKHALAFYNAITEKDVIVVAHNAPFEQCITRHVLKRDLAKFGVMVADDFKKILPSEKWLCTASMAAAASMPQRLEDLCKALELEHEKDMVGNRIMLQLSKPRKPTKNNPDTWVVDNDKFDHMMRYCVDDIVAECAALVTLPMLSPEERKVWILDQKINFDGVKIDRPLVKKIIKLIKEETEILENELWVLTKGEVKSAKAVKQMLSWLGDNGCYLPDLTKKTIEDALKNELAEGACKRVLEIRQQLGKSSVSKYPAFLEVSEDSGYMKLGLRYHGANTGRWSGMGVQPQNFPRGNVKEVWVDENGKKHERDLSIEISEFIANGATLKDLKEKYGQFSPMDIFSSCLRNMLIARDGHEFFVSDFAAIEARVLFWVADHKEGCQAFFENRKMYEEMAMLIFNVKRIEDVTKDQRFVGKQTLLGAGYSMGWKKFQASCEQFGQYVSNEVAQKAIKTYRETHYKVPELWKNLEKVAILAIQNPKKKYSINHTKWYMKGKWLCCELPSGRCLRYYNPSVEWGETPWGEKKPLMRYWCVNSVTKKWFKEKTYGGALAENVVQAISRDLMVNAMWNEHKAGYKLRLTVHDELIAEREIGQGCIKEFEEIMRTTPEWAAGCPVNVEGWHGTRYRK